MTITTLAGDDATTLDQVRTSRRDGLRFASLTGGAPANAETDFELAGILCRYTPDDAQVARLMRATSLRRPKWDQVRGAGTYLDLMIDLVRQAAR